MDKKIVSNYFYNVLYQIFVLVTPLITVPYVTRTLGADVLGISDWTSSNVQWFVLFGCLGVSIYGNKTIAIVRDDIQLRSKTFWEIFTMQLISMFLSAIVYIFFIIFANAKEYQLYALIQGISLISVSLDVTWFFYGMEDFKQASIRNVIIKILSIVCIFTMIKKPSDLALFIFLNAISGVVGQLWMWTQLKQYIHFTKVKLNDVLKHFKPNFMLFVPQIATSIYTLLDVSMLGYLNADKAQVSYYQNAQRFIKMFLFFITSIGSVMLPRVANLNSKGDSDSIFNYLKITLRMAMLLALPMMAGIIAMIDTFIGWFLDPSYSVVSFLIIITSPIILFISLSNVYGTQYLLPIGKTKIYTSSVVSGAVVNCIINACLMPSLGAVGAIIGSVVSEFVVMFIQWVYIRKYTTIRLQADFMIRYFIASVIMGLAVYFIAHKLPLNFLSNIISIGIGVIIYLLLLILMKDSFTIELIKKIKGMVIKHD